MTVEAVKEAISGEKQLTVLIGRKLGQFSKYKHHQTKVSYRDSVKLFLRLYPSRPGYQVRNNLILDRLEAVCGYTVKILGSAVRAAIGKHRGTEDTNELFIAANMNVSVSAASTALRKAKPTATTPSRQPLSSGNWGERPPLVLWATQTE
jgi:hypothetical protein